MGNESPNIIPTLSGSRSGPQSVGRIFSILESLSSTAIGATLSELAVSTGAPKTSLVGLLAGLIEEKCLIRDEGGRYFLGPRFLALAMKTMAGRELVKLARPVLQKLVDDSQETAVIGALASDADLAIYLDRVESSSSIRYAVTVGERRELHCTAMGKVLLAGFDADRLDQYFEKTKLVQFTDKTVVKKSDLQLELTKIRKEGIARTSNERVIGASGVAAPIFSADGSVVAALVIAGPTERFIQNIEAHEVLVRHAAAECTRLAGGTPAQSAMED